MVVGRWWKGDGRSWLIFPGRVEPDFRWLVGVGIELSGFSVIVEANFKNNEN